MTADGIKRASGQRRENRGTNVIIIWHLSWLGAGSGLSSSLFFPASHVFTTHIFRHRQSPSTIVRPCLLRRNQTGKTEADHRETLPWSTFFFLYFFRVLSGCFFSVSLSWRGRGGREGQEGRRLLLQRLKETAKDGKRKEKERTTPSAKLWVSSEDALFPLVSLSYFYYYGPYWHSLCLWLFQCRPSIVYAKCYRGKRNHSKSGKRKVYR